jgi:6-phosphogluconate dehydrogenase
MAEWVDFLKSLHAQLVEIPNTGPLLNDQSFEQAIHNLTEALRDTIQTRIKLKRPVPQSR